MRRLHRFLPLVLITGIAAGACGAAELAAPRIALRQAAAQVADAQRTSFTVSFSGNEADAIALFSEGEEDVTAEDRKEMATMFHSQLSMAMDQGADRADPKDDASDLDIRIGDVDHAVQMRQVDGKIYARADVRRLMEIFGGSPTDLNSFLADAKKMGLDFLPGAVDGGWLALDIAPLESFFKGLAKSGGNDMFGGFDPTNIDAGVLKPLLSAISGAYGTDVDVERLSSDGSGQHYRLSASARRLYQRLLPELKKLPMMKGLGEDEFPASADVPDERYELDVWVADRRITRAEFNLSQFMAAGHRPGPVVLRVDVNDRPDGIAAPAKSELLDIFEIWGRLMGSFTSGLEGDAQYD